MDARSDLPDPNATGNPGGLHQEFREHPEDREVASREAEERDAARRRGRERRRAGEAGHDPELGRADPQLAHRAFAALADNVRDYAIFLMDRNGIIRFWGEGAYLLKAMEEGRGQGLPPPAALQGWRLRGWHRGGPPDGCGTAW